MLYLWLEIFSEHYRRAFSPYQKRSLHFSFTFFSKNKRKKGKPQTSTVRVDTYRLANKGEEESEDRKTIATVSMFVSRNRIRVALLDTLSWKVADFGSFRKKSLCHHDMRHSGSAARESDWRSGRSGTLVLEVLEGAFDQYLYRGKHQGTIGCALIYGRGKRVLSRNMGEDTTCPMSITLRRPF